MRRYSFRIVFIHLTTHGLYEKFSRHKVCAIIANHPDFDNSAMKKGADDRFFRQRLADSAEKRQVFCVRDERAGFVRPTAASEFGNLLPAAG